MKAFKHCLPDTTIPLSCTILVQSSFTTLASTRTYSSLGIKARLLAIPTSIVCLATLANFSPTSNEVIPSSTATSELNIVNGVSVGLYDGVVLGTLVGLKLGIFDGTVDGVELGKGVGD